MGAEGYALRALPLKQYELVLQNAQQVLDSLLKQPPRPWLCFRDVVRDLGRQASVLNQQAAACRLQRAFRLHRAQRAATKAASRATEVAMAMDALPATAQPPTGRQKPPTPPSAPCTSAPAPVAMVYHRVSAPSGSAMNPLEKRRHLIAGQLAMKNPTRLARCHRASWQVHQPRQVADIETDSGKAGSTAPRPRSSSGQDRSSPRQLVSPRSLMSPRRNQDPATNTPATNRRALITAQLTGVTEAQHSIGHNNSGYDGNRQASHATSGGFERTRTPPRSPWDAACDLQPSGHTGDLALKEPPAADDPFDAISGLGSVGAGAGLSLAAPPPILSQKPSRGR